MQAIAAQIRAALDGLSDQALALMAVAVAAVAMVCVWRLLRRAPSDAGGLAELGDLLAQHERQIADVLDRRLSRSADTIDASLDRTQAAAHTALSGLAERIGRIDAAQTRLAGLGDQIAGLERTFANKQARGAFGEARLSDLLRDALPADAFVEQANLPNGRRADALVLLPTPPGPVAIDAKFPLERFLEMDDAETPAMAASARKAFKRDVMRHVDDIADRYIVPGATAECALMFVPSEAVFAEIQARCRDVVEAGFRRRVYIVSPTTLWATLNTTRAVLKDARILEESQALQAAASGLVTDVAKLASQAETARRRLELALADLEGLATAARSAERRARDIADFQIAPPTTAPDDPQN